MRSNQLIRRSTLDIVLKNCLLRELSFYILAVILCLIILSLTLTLWKVDLRIPFSYSGDSLLFGTCIKSLIDTGWYLNNTFLGAPTSLTMYDVPWGGNLDFFILKIISLLFPYYGLTLNIFFLLSFPLVTLTSFYVFRQFNISHIPSIVFSLLYTFLPYHFLRGENHIFLSTYYVIPLIIMVTLWIFTEYPLLFTQSDHEKYRLDLFKSKSIMSILICILISMSMGYYAFFSCFFLLIAGVASSIFYKSKYPFIASIIFTLIIIIGLLINNSPTLLYQFEYGKNMVAGVRSPPEAEYYGLKIIQLFMPVSGHRISWLSNLTSWYNSHEPLINENVTSSLGIIGSIGLIVSIVWAFYRISNNTCIRQDTFLILLTALSICNVSAIFLGTIGGIGSIVSMIYPQIRAYNRISIFIAFFSLFTVLLLLEYVKDKYLKHKNTIFFGIVIVVLLIGILDQTNDTFIPDYKSTAQEFTNDEKFVHQIEEIMPANSMIYQLPYIPFPESPPQHKMTDYDLFKGYLHSTDLKWSYGSIKGRDGDLWQQNVSKMPVNEMLVTLSSSGFDGIYLDSYGYEDGGKNIIAQLSNALGVEPIISDNNRLYYFDMTDYNKKLKNNYANY